SRLPRRSARCPYTTLSRSPVGFCGALEKQLQGESFVLNGRSNTVNDVRRRVRISYGRYIIIADLTVSIDILITNISRLHSSPGRSEEHTSELQSRENLVCR